MDGPLIDSVFSVESTERDNGRFGTAFLIGYHSNISYFISCAHVIRDVGGAEKVLIDRRPAVVVRISPDTTPDDIAVLQVVGYAGAQPLILGGVVDEGTPFLAAGFQRSMNRLFAIRTIRGKLGQQIALQLERRRVPAWDLMVEGQTLLQPGYSGAPVVRHSDGAVVAVITQRSQEGKVGVAISITAVTELWPERQPADQGSRLLTSMGREPRPESAPHEVATGHWVVLNGPERVFADQLVRLYPSPSDIERVLAKLEVTVPVSPVEDPPIDRCRRIVQAAMDNGRLDELINIVSKEYPRDQQWIDAVLAYKEHNRSQKGTALAGVERSRLNAAENIIGGNVAEPLALTYLANFRRCTKDLQWLFRTTTPDRGSSSRQVDVRLTPVKLKIWDLQRCVEQVQDIAELPSLGDEILAVKLRNDLRVLMRSYTGYADSLSALIRSDPLSAQRDAHMRDYRSKSETLLRQLWATQDTLSSLVPHLAEEQRPSG